MPITLNTTRRRAALGGLVGATAVVGSIFVLTGAASADDDTPADDAMTVTTLVDAGFAEPSVAAEDFAAYDACVERELGIDFDSFDENTPEPSDRDWDAADEACKGELPEGIEVLELLIEGDLELLDEDGLELVTAELIEDDALAHDFAAYDACLERELGIDFDSFDENTPEPSDRDWDAADEACEGELPEGIELITVEEADLVELDGWIEADEGEMAALIEG